MYASGSHVAQGEAVPRDPRVVAGPEGGRRPPAGPALRMREKPPSPSTAHIKAALIRRRIGAATVDRHRNGVAVSRTSGPMRTTSSSWKRLASAMLSAPDPANAGLPPPPMRTGAM